MGNLKSNLKSKNSYFLSLAFEQAKVNLGCTGVNPSVGCIVEKNGSVISSGRTSLKGRPHAEFNALKKKVNFKDSNIYITLEPCSHYGLTPPCTNKIIQKKIKKVFFSVFDEDLRSKKLSVKKFKKRKMVVKSGIKSEYGLFFYNSYFIKKKNFLPYLDAKIAISKDYFTKSKKSKWITNEHSRKRAHLLRTNYDCILSTSKSINEDNSELNCRIDGLEKKSPSIAIIDRNFRLKKNIKLIKNRGGRKIYLFTSTSNKRKEKYLKRKGIKVIKIKKMKTYKDFKEILFKLSNFGFSRILLETGLSFLNFFLLGKIVQNLHIFKTNSSLKKNGINNTTSSLIKNIELKKKVKVNLFGDSLYRVNLK